jgi:biopolymer transport protein ExbD
MGQNKNQKAITDINITPFVDVVLVLLVIFMVTTPLVVSQALKVELPKSKTSSPTESETLGLAITTSGAFVLNGQTLAKEALFEAVKIRHQKNPGLQVVIAADMDTPHRFVIQAMDTVKRAGVDKLAFQVAREE